MCEPIDAAVASAYGMLNFVRGGARLSAEVLRTFPSSAAPARHTTSAPLEAPRTRIEANRKEGSDRIVASNRVIDVACSDFSRQMSGGGDRRETTRGLVFATQTEWKLPGCDARSFRSFTRQSRISVSRN